MALQEANDALRQCSESLATSEQSVAALQQRVADQDAQLVQLQDTLQDRALLLEQREQHLMDCETYVHGLERQLGAVVDREATLQQQACPVGCDMLYRYSSAACAGARHGARATSPAPGA